MCIIMISFMTLMLSLDYRTDINPHRVVDMIHIYKVTVCVYAFKHILMYVEYMGEYIQHTLEGRY